uniref:Uncharacterized protein n=1 Tax=Glossina austeni TaxID=7395 RepID=A0A1A9UUB5_GLOAU
MLLEIPVVTVGFEGEENITNMMRFQIDLRFTFTAFMPSSLQVFLAPIFGGAFPSGLPVRLRKGTQLNFVNPEKARKISIMNLMRKESQIVAYVLCYAPYLNFKNFLYTFQESLNNQSVADSSYNLCNDYELSVAAIYLIFSTCSLTH